MESIISILNSMNVAEIIAIIFMAYLVIKKPLDQRLDDQGKRLDDLKDMFKSELQANRDLFKSELESKIKPIEIALNNHITDTHKEIKALNEKLDKIISKNK